MTIIPSHSNLIKFTKAGDTVHDPDYPKVSLTPPCPPGALGAEGCARAQPAAAQHSLSFSFSLVTRRYPTAQFEWRSLAEVANCPSSSQGLHYFLGAPPWSRARHEAFGESRPPTYARTTQ
ncbi:MAG: hypothetical protein ACFCVA_13950 [Gammaproteobacteria bacterium]